jgi:hypothetical protein
MEQRKRFYVALGIYAVLGLLIWMTMSDVPFPIGGYHFSISFRRLTLGVLVLFVVRTVLHWRAEGIRASQRHEQQDEVSS